MLNTLSCESLFATDSRTTAWLLEDASFMAVLAVVLCFVPSLISAITSSTLLTGYSRASVTNNCLALSSRIVSVLRVSAAAELAELNAFPLNTLSRVALPAAWACLAEGAPSRSIMFSSYIDTVLVEGKHST